MRNTNTYLLGDELLSDIAQVHCGSISALYRCVLRHLIKRALCVLVFVAEMLNADNVPALVNIECMRCTQSQSGALLLCDANGGRASERVSCHTNIELTQLPRR